MPEVAPSDGAKRKRSSTASKPAKRRRSTAASDDEADGGAKILLLEQGILESRKNYNDIGLLLATAEGAGDESMLATVALGRVFLRLLAQGSLAMKKKPLSEKDGVVVAWLRDRLSQYKRLLLRLLADPHVAVTALTLCMRVLKAEGERGADKDGHSFPAAFLEDIVRSVLASDADDGLRAYVQDFVEQHDDIRYYTFKSMRPVLDSLSGQLQPPGALFDRAFSLLSSLDGVPTTADELQDFYVAAPHKKSHPLLSVAQHKKQAQDAWLALMEIVETKDQRKRILEATTTVIAPWFSRPELLADFLTSCYDAGGSMSLLALSGVFYLIRERNLDYPSFYTKLYSLLDRDVLHSRHRSRFFRLLDTFLASTHLPAALVASFIKRLARLALNAPTSAIATVTPCIYNLLRRHPSCTFLLHRDLAGDDEARRRARDEGFGDAFLADEADPMATGAIDSCLWELVQLQSHYHPNVATICKIISEQFTKQSYNMEDFLDHSYASLLEAETAKAIRKAPVVEFHVPAKVFLPHEGGDGAADSLLVKLWDFGGGGAS